MNFPLAYHFIKFPNDNLPQPTKSPEYYKDQIQDQIALSQVLQELIDKFETQVLCV